MAMSGDAHLSGSPEHGGMPGLVVRILRHQVNILRRRSKRPKLNLVDRMKLLVGARLSPSWRRATSSVQRSTAQPRASA
jgi:hypothetical protein